jgi:response regulator RpfG family c-di-GMP phosphodiesterase
LYTVPSGSAGTPNEDRLRALLLALRSRRTWHSAERVLVVDDEPGREEVAREILRTRGYDISKPKTDLVVTDVLMPKMSDLQMRQ